VFEGCNRSNKELAPDKRSSGCRSVSHREDAKGAKGTEEATTKTKEEIEQSAELVMEAMLRERVSA